MEGLIKPASIVYEGIRCLRCSQRLPEHSRTGCSRKRLSRSEADGTAALFQACFLGGLGGLIARADPVREGRVELRPRFP